VKAGNDQFRQERWSGRPRDYNGHRGELVWPALVRESEAPRGQQPPRRLARRHEVLPIGVTPLTLTVATSDPSNLAGRDEVKLHNPGPHRRGGAFTAAARGNPVLLPPAGPRSRLDELFPAQRGRPARPRCGCSSRQSPPAFLASKNSASDFSRPVRRPRNARPGVDRRNTTSRMGMGRSGARWAALNHFDGAVCAKAQQAK
jgi:hypothetical protein